MKSFLRRCLALVLVIAMSISGGINAFAASKGLDGIDFSYAESIEVDPNGNFEMLSDKLENSKEKFEGYKADEKVTFIIELEGDSVLEAKPDSVTVGEFMDTSKGNATLDNISDEQDSVREYFNPVGYDFEVEYSYKVVMNGFAVSGPYAAKAYLESIPGVKSVSVAKTYEIVNPARETTYASITSGGLLDSDVSNANGYTGKGTVTAILDTGLDYNHSAFAAAPEEPTLDKDDIAAIVASGKLNATAIVSEATEDNLYISEKIPFAFDYASKDTDVYDYQQHGTHVAGTVGANCSDFKGVAPDTQLVILKVFDDAGGGATDAVIFAALEDAVILGVDAINMSLGSPGGFTYEDETTEAVYGAVKAAGINLMISAGNETDSIDNTESEDNHYGLALASNPDNGIVGSPSTYDAALSVASVNEYQNYVSYILSGERKICFNDANMETSLDFVKKFDGETLEYVAVPGYGEASDYEGIDVNGKIALVSRGTIAFTDKEANAAAAGAIGMIVYDNTVGDLLYMQSAGLLPEIFISNEDGLALAEQETKTISVSSDYSTFANVSDGGLMSDFSSIGTAPDLSIKPEITAPGGYVYSTLPGDVYGSMSGTSMAAPHMTGAAAVMQQYVNDTFPNLSATERQELINTLLMNTAVQVTDEYGTEYSVRKQGAGLAQVNKAINTEAYVTVKGSERPKAELGDNANGEFSFTLTVHNFGRNVLTYNMSSIDLVAAIDSDGYDFYNLGFELSLSEEDMVVKFSEDTVVVPAGGEVSVDVTLTATEEFKEGYLDYFENGTFLEGYIVLEQEGGNGINLSVPYLGFYGDWGKAPVFDATLYDDEYANVYTGAALAINALGNGFYLGVNLLDDEGVIAPDANKIAISADTMNRGYMPTMNIGLLRGPKTLTYTVTDSEGNLANIFALDAEAGKVYYYGTEVSYSNVIKSFYYTNGGFINSEYGPTYDGWLPVVPTGAGLMFLEGQHYFNATATVDGTNSPAGTQTTSMPIYLDHEEPQLLGTKHEKIDGEDWVYLAIYDNHYNAACQLISPDYEKAYSDLVLIDEDEIGKTTVLKFNTTNLVNAGITSARLDIVDYAMNETVSYEFSLEADTLQPSTIHVVNDIAFITGGESFIVEAYISPNGVSEEDAGVTWTSSDERIAVVEALESGYDDELGIIYRALVTTRPRAMGQVEITATTRNGKSDSTIVNVVVKGYEDPSDPSDPSFPDLPTEPGKPSCDHDWSSWEYDNGFMKRTCDKCGITEFVPAEKTEDETNPNTGAFVKSEAESYSDSSYPDSSYPGSSYPGSSYPDSSYPDSSYPDSSSSGYPIESDKSSCEHDWSDWEEDNGFMKRTCNKCGITEFVPVEKNESEANPNTGASVSNVIVAMVVVAGSAIVLKKIRK